ncbi:MAG: diheme cytochrome c-553 [bacterium]|nr:diheme cytochrome c-553 [bacterium]
MRRGYFIAAISAIFFIVLFVQLGCSEEGKAKPKTQEEMIALGKYLVHTSACDDCHTPKIFTEDGRMILDTTRLLSGHPQDQVVPSLDKSALKMDWIASNMNLTTWVGPWGVSYSANLTPDKATGIGTVTEEMFIKTMRDGKLKGVGRGLLPPMPWEVYRLKTDEDLKAMYAYLMSIKPIRNQVPLPVPPDKAESFLAAK